MRFSTVPALLAIGIGLAACQEQYIHEGPATGVRVNDPHAPNARLNLDTVVILDKRLQSSGAGKLAIEASGGRRTETGTLEVAATIRNRTDFPQQIEVRVQFFDASAFPVEGPSAWKRMNLPPNGIVAYREYSAGTTSIAHYYVEIRESI